MKTEQEIKDRRYNINKAMDLDDGEQYEILQTRADMLDWVLEEPEYKRTIFDLTEEELIELCQICISYDLESNSKITNYEKYNNKIKFTLKYNYFIHNIKEYIVHIYTNLDFSIDRFCIGNQAKYINRIQEMLSNSEIPNLSNNIGWQELEDEVLLRAKREMVSKMLVHNNPKNTDSSDHIADVSKKVGDE